MKKVLWGCLFLLGGLIGSLSVTGTIRAENVETEQQLRQLFKQEEPVTITLQQDIAISKSLVSEGQKKVIGGKHIIYRQEGFGGTMCQVKSGCLTVEQLQWDGASSRSTEVYGRVFDVRKNGKLLLQTGCQLMNNDNRGANNDGGGAVRVEQGARLELNGGTITQNKNTTYGAGVQILSGGRFTMRSGTIQKNTTSGIGAVAGFDGKGGGIYNAGICEIYGGRICENRATGYMSSKKGKGTIVYGGFGGGIYHCGEKLLLAAGMIKDNRSHHAEDIYVGKNTIQIHSAVETGTIYNEFKQSAKKTRKKSSKRQKKKKKETKIAPTSVPAATATVQPTVKPKVVFFDTPTSTPIPVATSLPAVEPEPVNVEDAVTMVAVEPEKNQNSGSQTWVFRKEDIVKVRDFCRREVSMYSSESIVHFLEQFMDCCQEESVKDEISSSIHG